MLILGIESSCDETSASVVEMSEEQRVIRSNIVASQIDVHRVYGGVVPEIASRAHVEAVSGITEQALREAGVRLGEIGAIAVKSGNGIGNVINPRSENASALIESIKTGVVLLLGGGWGNDDLIGLSGGNPLSKLQPLQA